MAINKAERMAKKVAEEFKHKSYTETAMSTAYDWDGVKTIKLATIDTIPLSDYDRTSAKTAVTIGDVIQIASVNQDKAFHGYIDAGDNAEQENIKGANQALQREIDKEVIPTQDKHRLSVWSKGAGCVVGITAMNNTAALESIFQGAAELDEAEVPADERTLFVTPSVYNYLVLDSRWTGVDSLGEKALGRGIVGAIDGMQVRKVPASFFPTGVYWLIAYKESILGPTKLKNYHINIHPEGRDGQSIFGRVLYDAFVRGSMDKGVCVGINNSYTIAKPTITNDTTNSKIVIASATTGVDIWYTTDGSSPLHSNSAVKVGSNTNNITYANANNAATRGGSIKFRAVAVPNSNTALFHSAEADPLVYA